MILCGCQTMRGSEHGHFKDLTGQRVGPMLVLSLAGWVDQADRRIYKWRCRCCCGAEYDIRSKDLHSRYGRRGPDDCKCRLRRQRLGPTRNGQTKHPLYQIWATMRKRCLSPNHRKYPSYGGRGIKICSRWDDFMAFVADMGERPSTRHSLDRINVDGDYEPGNCRWATFRQQARNKRVLKVLTLKRALESVVTATTLEAAKRAAAAGLRAGEYQETLFQ